MQFLKSILSKYPQLMGKLEAHIKIDNQPYMPLSIEYIGLGPRGLPALSVTHYGEQNGDLMRDPEMCFEMEIENGTVTEFHPYSFRNDYIGFEQNAVASRDKIDTKAIQSMRVMAETWDRNLRLQGFLAARVSCD